LQLNGCTTTVSGVTPLTVLTGFLCNGCMGGGWKSKVKKGNDFLVGMDQEKVWDIIAPGWAHVKPFQYRDTAKMFSFVLTRWKPGKLMDLGCGAARDSILFAQKSFSVTSVDFSAKMLEEAREQCEKKKVNVDLKKSFVNNLSFDDNTFDYVWYCNVLSAVEGADARFHSLKEIFRVLKPGGEAVISGWNRLQRKLIFKGGDCFVPWRKKDVVVQRFYHNYFPWELKRLLKKSGFKIIMSSSWFSSATIFLIRKP